VNYEEKAKEILAPFCKYCLPVDSAGKVAAALREAAAEAFEEAAKEIQDNIGVIDFYTIRKNIRARAAALRPAPGERGEANKP